MYGCLCTYFELLMIGEVRPQISNCILYFDEDVFTYSFSKFSRETPEIYFYQIWLECQQLEIIMNKIGSPTWTIHPQQLYGHPISCNIQYQPKYGKYLHNINEAFDFKKIQQWKKKSNIMKYLIISLNSSTLKSYPGEQSNLKKIIQKLDK